MAIQTRPKRCCVKNRPLSKEGISQDSARSFEGQEALPNAASSASTCTGEERIQGLEIQKEDLVIRIRELENKKNEEQVQRRRSANDNKLWSSHTNNINSYNEQIQELQTKLEALSLSSEETDVDQTSSFTSDPIADKQVPPVHPAQIAPPQGCPAQYVPAQYVPAQFVPVQFVLLDWQHPQSYPGYCVPVQPAQIAPPQGYPAQRVPVQEYSPFHYEPAGSGAALSSAPTSMTPGQPSQISPNRNFYKTVVDFGNNIKNENHAYRQSVRNQIQKFDSINFKKEDLRAAFLGNLKASVFSMVEERQTHVCVTASFISNSKKELSFNSSTPPLLGNCMLMMDQKSEKLLIGEINKNKNDEGYTIKLLHERVKGSTSQDNPEGTVDLSIIGCLNAKLRHYKFLMDDEALSRSWRSFKNHADSRLQIESEYLSKLTTFSKLNKDQQFAVVKSTTSGVNVQGPPGTGKTDTLLACIMEAVKNPEKKLLVCGPSNQSILNIYKRLYEHLPKTADETLLRKCKLLLSENGLKLLEKNMPNNFEDQFKTIQDDSNGKWEDIIQDARVVFTTTNQTGKSFFSEMFSDVFIDEAAQVELIEGLMSTSALLTTGRLHMFGDIKQLPPVFNEKLEGADSQKSIQETFQSHGGDTVLLRKQYRTNDPVLMDLVNLQYDGQLEMGSLHPKVSKDTLTLVKCHGNQAPVGNSFINRKEADAAVKQALKLLKQYPSDTIGIISPYKQQVTHIQSLLNSRNITNIKVSSVDGFQGGEKHHIIISLVRDTEYGSFIDDAQRLNVTFSRAINSITLIGNPTALEKARSTPTTLSRTLAHFDNGAVIKETM